MSEFNIGDIFKNLGGMKEQMDQLKERVSRLRITGEAGAGMVRATVNGEGSLLNVEIDSDLLKPEEKDMLVELIVSAVNDAGTKAKEAAAHEMKGMMGGLPIPGLETLLKNFQ